MSSNVRFRFRLDLQTALNLLAFCYRFEVENRHCNITFDSNTENILTQVAEYFISDNPKIGLLLCGNVGNGKTTMMRAIQRCVNLLDSHRHFEFLDDVNFGYRFKPDFRIRDVGDLVRAAEDMEFFNNLKNCNMLGIDDLGKEPVEVMNYGNISTPIKDILEYRYNNQLFTCITTNLTPQNIREKYGERIADRFREMFTFIVFKSQTYRK